MATRGRSVFVIDVISASTALSDYTGQYQSVPQVLNDTHIICVSYNRGAGADFPDVDREFVFALNGVDFVRTQRTFKYFDTPFNISHMEPVTSEDSHSHTQCPPGRSIQ